VEVVASLSQGRTAAGQCSLFTHKSVPVIFEPPCIFLRNLTASCKKSTKIVHRLGTVIVVWCQLRELWHFSFELLKLCLVFSFNLLYLNSDITALCDLLTVALVQSEWINV